MSASNDIRAGGAFVELRLHQSHFIHGLEQASHTMKHLGRELSHIGRFVAEFGAIMAAGILEATHAAAEYGEAMAKAGRATEDTEAMVVMGHAIHAVVDSAKALVAELGLAAGVSMNPVLHQLNDILHSTREWLKAHRKVVGDILVGMGAAGLVLTGVGVSIVLLAHGLKVASAAMGVFAFALKVVNWGLGIMNALMLANPMTLAIIGIAAAIAGIGAAVLYATGGLQKLTGEFGRVLRLGLGMAVAIEDAFLGGRWELIGQLMGAGIKAGLFAAIANVLEFVAKFDLFGNFKIMSVEMGFMADLQIEDMARLRKLASGARAAKTGDFEHVGIAAKISTAGTFNARAVSGLGGNATEQIRDHTKRTADGVEKLNGTIKEVLVWH